MLKLNGSARLPVLDGHHSQVSALVSGLRRWSDDLANQPHGIDDLRAGGVRVELSVRLDLLGPVCVRREHGHIGFCLVSAFAPSSETADSADDELATALSLALRDKDLVGLVAY